MDPVQFGNFLSEERKARGLTQKELAEQVGVSDKAVSKWERGVCLPDVAKFVDIAAALGISDLEVFRAERFKEPEEEEKTEPLITWRRARALLLCCFCSGIVCFIGESLGDAHIFHLIGLFNIIYAVLGPAFGVFLAFRCAPARLDSRGTLRAALLICALLGLVVWFIYGYRYQLDDLFLRLCTLGMDREQRWEWQYAMFGPEMTWSTAGIFVRYIAYMYLSIPALCSLPLCFAVFLAVRLWRSLRWERKNAASKAA